MIQSSGIAAGSMTADIEGIKMLKELGYNFIAYLNDSAAIKIHFDTILNELN